MATNRKTTKSAGAPAGTSPRARKAAPPADASTLVDLAQQVRSWTDTVLGVAGAAADVDPGRGEDDAAEAGAARRRWKRPAPCCGACGKPRA